MPKATGKAKGTTRKATPSALDKVRATALATTRPSEFARAVGIDGKQVRDVLRHKVGVYVSRGAAFDDKAKAALFDALQGRIVKRMNTATDKVDA